MLGLGLGLPLVAVRGGSPPFSPSILYAAMQAGLWVEPSDYAATGFQDSAGTTPQTAVEQPTGLRLDKRLGLALGASALPAGPARDFSADTYWSKDAGATISGGTANWAASVTNVSIYTVGALTIGVLYEITFTITNISAGAIRCACGNALGTPRSTPGTYKERLVADSSVPRLLAFGASTTANVSFVNFVVVTGNHLLQATAANRPTLSARVNLLTVKTSDLTALGIVGASVTISGTTITATSGGGFHYVVRSPSDVVTGKTYAASFSVKSGTNPWMWFLSQSSSGFTYFNGATGAIGDVAAGHTATISPTADADGFWRCTVTWTATANAYGFGLALNGTTNSFSAAGTESISIKNFQLEYGSVATRYQDVVAGGATYDTANFPVYDSFNGTNGALATSTFAAGTLTANMDCFIAVRRNSTASAVLAYSDATHYLGSFAVGGAGSAALNSGTPTHYVDGVVVPGGSATTAGQLDTAVPINGWHILEIRNADLSTWTAFSLAGLSTLFLNGSVGGIILAPAQTNAVRAQIRTYIGAKVGLVL
jgi:hypothetical protein